MIDRVCSPSRSFYLVELPGLMNVGPRTTAHADLPQALDPGTVDLPTRRGDADNVLLGLCPSAPAPTAKASYDAAARPRHHAVRGGTTRGATPSTASSHTSERIATADTAHDARPVGRSRSPKAPLARASSASALGSSLLTPALPVQDTTWVIPRTPTPTRSARTLGRGNQYVV